MMELTGHFLGRQYLQVVNVTLLPGMAHSGLLEEMGVAPIRQLSLYIVLLELFGLLQILHNTFLQAVNATQWRGMGLYG